LNEKVREKINSAKETQTFLPERCCGISPEKYGHQQCADINLRAKTYANIQKHIKDLEESLE
jgi:hypothetical protein